MIKYLFILLPFLSFGQIPLLKINDGTTKESAHITRSWFSGLPYINTTQIDTFDTYLDMGYAVVGHLQVRKLTDSVTITLSKGATLKSISIDTAIFDFDGGRISEFGGSSILLSESKDSLFLDSERPLSNESDGPVELGLSFSTKKKGKITAIKFWKTTTANINYTVSLWNLAGQRISTKTYQSNRTRWNTVPFDVDIDAGVYRASYYASNSRYGQTEHFFDTARTRGEITGLMGFYSYDSKSTFPDSTYNSSQYGIDVVFQPIEEKPLIIFAGLDSEYAIKPDSVILKGDVQNAVSFEWQVIDSFGSVSVTGLNTLNPVIKPTYDSWVVMLLTGKDAAGNESASIVNISVMPDPKELLLYIQQMFKRWRREPVIIP
jgi:hypothetical protein